MYDSIIFDLDGTLWDETAVTAETWDAVLKNHPDVKCAVVIDSDAVGRQMGLTCEEIAELFFPDLSAEQANELVAESCKLENEWLPECGGILYPGVDEKLREMKNNGIRLFIVSNCQDGYVQAFLKAHGFSDVIEDFECSGRTGKSKAENIKLVIERCGLKNPVYVGDTSSDRDGARGAGIPFIYAKYGFGEKYGRGKTDDYDFSIETFGELLKLI